MSVIYEDSNYGTQGFAELERAAIINGICFATTHRVDYDSSHWDDDNYNAIVKSVAEKIKSTGLVQKFHSFIKTKGNQ